MESFRRHIAMVPQSPVVFNMTILENIKYPDSDCTMRRPLKHVKRPHCMTRSCHSRTAIKKRWRAWHQALWRRIAETCNCEAMLKKADILLLDEATSSVDSITEKEIQGSIRELCEGKTAFVIAHRLSTILHADHILVVRDGQIVESAHMTLSSSGKELIATSGAVNSGYKRTIALKITFSLPTKRRCPYSHQRHEHQREERPDSGEKYNREDKIGDDDQTRRGTHSETSSVHEHEHRAHQTSHATSNERGRMNAKRLARALGKRFSQSKSPERSGSNKPVLKPDAPEFVPRRFQVVARPQTRHTTCIQRRLRFSTESRSMVLLPKPGQDLFRTRRMTSRLASHRVRFQKHAPPWCSL